MVLASVPSSSGSCQTRNPQASSGFRYTAPVGGRLRSTSKRERHGTRRVGHTTVQRSVNGSSSRSRSASFKASFGSKLGRTWCAEWRLVATNGPLPRSISSKELVEARSRRRDVVFIRFRPPTSARVMRRATTSVAIRSLEQRLHEEHQARAIFQWSNSRGVEAAYDTHQHASWLCCISLA